MAHPFPQFLYASSCQPAWNNNYLEESYPLEVMYLVEGNWEVVMEVALQVEVVLAVGV